MTIPKNKQYEHKTLFHYYYKDLNGNWTRCRRFSYSDWYQAASYGDECYDKRNTPFNHYRRNTQLSTRDFILKRVLIPVYVMAGILLTIFVLFLLSMFL
ncbi:hypothetical protein bpr_IV073 (plasmid) [Butyrivibrio proteoclasticus B316]|uniref:Uncharacterized protein n=1 Tax=Butyrivibrio proteoclasticus (strain ATCC 51982 / DSM 14932 / B316) TaxID=515622 RepID=E0S4V6_BUTPB|nr:hypothetical protein bpr_IV073 [Butyrivibrio proteoclasticus B316]